ncbi:MAG: sulfite exporter TauE/SafE family protein, partial [Chloroflexi bacterium]|nr:sulfite exporter TauE/SafE family protein [Chloroflexota bacterium]
MELGWLEAVVVVFAMLLASTVFSATGFGIGMISTPLMLLVYEPQTVIVVAGTAGLGIGVWIISKSWRDVPFREVLPITIAALCGAPIAVFILTTADSSILSIGIAVLIILFAIGSFVKVEREIPYSTPVGIAAGFIVGVLLPTSGVAGSLVMLFLMTKKWERQTVRAAMAFFLLALMSFSI